MCPECKGGRTEVNGAGMRIACTICCGKGVIEEDCSINASFEDAKQIPEPLRRKPGRKPSISHPEK